MLANVSFSSGLDLGEDAKCETVSRVEMAISRYDKPLTNYSFPDANTDIIS